MPTLTIDLSEEAYQAAIAVPSADRIRLVSDLFISPAELPRVPPKQISPETLIRLRQQAARQAEHFAALDEQWASEPSDPHEPTFEEFVQATNETRKANGERLLYPEPKETR
jgi:hypothetical protein